MPKTQTTKVDVAILGRTYRVTCAADELDALQAAARRVDVAMRQVQRAGVALSLDRIAVMAALNIATDTSPKTTPRRPPPRNCNGSPPSSTPRLSLDAHAGETAPPIPSTKPRLRLRRRLQVG